MGGPSHHRKDLCPNCGGPKGVENQYCRKCAFRGERHWHWGGSNSEATRRNISRALAGRVFTDEWREKMSLAKSGPNHPRWNGGRGTTGEGYIKIKTTDHPFATRGGYVLEHRLVAEKSLGRFLRPEEVVHHTNEIRSDNRPENLVICPNNTYHRLIHRRMNERRKACQHC